MKCKNCGYSLQIEDVVCPSCGTPNPFAQEHREEMDKFAKEFKETQEAVIDTTKKTAGVLIKFSIGLLFIIAAITIMITSGSTTLKDKAKIRKVQANLDKYRAEYEELEKGDDYILLEEWYGANYINKVPEFNDCLNVFNVCMYYKYVASAVADVTYEECIEYAVWDKEDYCENIIESYDMMRRYAQSEFDKDEVNQGHRDCINACVNHTRVLIQGTFGLSQEQIDKFDDVTANERIGMLLENWPYED